MKRISCRRPRSITAPNGDIFVADGHSPLPPVIPANLDTADDEIFQGRKIHQAMGQEPAVGPSQFNNPHDASPGSQGRLLCRGPRQHPHPDFQPGRQVAGEWTQFGRARGFYIDRMGTAVCDRCRLQEPFIPAGPRASGSAASQGGQPTPSCRMIGRRRRGRRRRRQHLRRGQCGAARYYPICQTISSKEKRP